MAATREILRQRKRLIGAAVGSGMAAIAAEGGGADLLMALSAGYFRSQGCSSMAALLPFANANRLTWDVTVCHILPSVRRTPVILGVCAQDPTVDWNTLFRDAQEHGIAGVTNFPSVGFLDGQYRAALEETGLGMAAEDRMLAAAKKFGLLTIGFCFNLSEAQGMAECDVDIVNLDLGFAEWRQTEATAHQAALDRGVALINEVTNGLKQAGRDTYTVIFGGPVVFPQDLEQVFQRTGIQGYIGGSTVESFPAAPTIVHTVREFKQAAARSYKHRLGAITGTSTGMQELFERIRRVAQSDAPTLIVGESGTGKELVAREIHRQSLRAAQPLVCWNCGATTETLAMTELFGHEKGAFTGATRAHTGKFETANGTTLFMDEVADLPPSVQASLLRVLQEKEIVRVGSQRTVPVDVRLIAASNKDFVAMIQSGLVELIMRSVRRNGRVTKPFYVLTECWHGRNTEGYV